MLKKTIKYTDYDGNEREEDFYFNLNKAEIVDWLTTSGGYTLDRVMEKLVKTENGKEIMDIFKDLIIRSYGEKSLDGKRFMKSEEIKLGFIESEAYSELYMELLNDTNKAVEFFNGVIPKDLASDIETMMKDRTNLPESVQKYLSNETNSANNVTPISEN